jgi:hypothetical protein
MNFRMKHMSSGFSKVFLSDIDTDQFFLVFEAVLSDKFITKQKVDFYESYHIAENACKHMKHLVEFTLEDFAKADTD